MDLEREHEQRTYTIMGGPTASQTRSDLDQRHITDSLIASLPRLPPPSNLARLPHRATDPAQGSTPGAW